MSKRIKPKIFTHLSFWNKSKKDEIDETPMKELSQFNQLQYQSLPKHKGSVTIWLYQLCEKINSSKITAKFQV